MLPRRFERIRDVLSRRQPDLTVLMDAVHKEHNLSAIVRSCDAAGVLEIHAVVPRGGLRIHRDTSGGASGWVPLHRHENVGSAIARLKDGGHHVVAAHPGERAVDFRDLDYTRATAFLVGGELEGLSEEALQGADHAVAIPMHGMVRSLNVSVSAALLLYEAERQRRAAGFYDEVRLDEGRYRRLLFEWAYPRHAEACRRAGRSYPDLGEDGQILSRDGGEGKARGAP